LIAAETPQWYETLTEAERQECAAELTDAYFAALTTDAWDAFRQISREWRERAAARELVTA
jgi:hypothetical protein